MFVENLPTLRIHKLTREQYEREEAAGRLEENAIYLTPDEGVDLSEYATIDQLENKSDKGHNHDDKYDAKNSASNALKDAKNYTDTKTSGLASTSSVGTSISAHNTSTTAHSDIRNLITGLTNRLNALADSDDTTLDQMSEVVAYIKSNKSLIEEITTNKVNVDDIVNNLTTNVESKALSAAQGVVIKGLIDALTAADAEIRGIATNAYTRLTTLVESFNSHVANHAPANAQPNQNAFSNIAVSNQTTVAADTATDTVTFVGSNVTITTDATNDKVTFAVADGSTSAKGVVQLTNSTSSTSTTTAATPNSVKSAYDLANTAKTNADNAQTRADNAYTLAESKVDSLSDLGITATATELNYVDGVTSNVQTQLNGKVPTSRTVNGKVLSSNITLSASDVSAYSKTEIDNMTFITVEDIDTICGTSIQYANVSEGAF